MITTKGKKVQGNPMEFDGKYLQFGFNEIAIMGNELVKAKTSDKVQTYFHVEAPTDKKDFEGVQWKRLTEDSPEVKASGPYNNVKLGIYIDPTNESKIEGILSDLGAIGDATNKREAVDTIQASTLQEFIDAFVGIVKGTPFYAKLIAEEYNTDRYNLAFGHYKAKDGNFYIMVKSTDEVKSIETIQKEPLHQKMHYINKGETEQKKMEFKKNSKYDYKPVSDDEADTPADVDDAIQGEEATF